MITVRLFGGLGNQLFQYAVGRALAVKHNTELRLDARLAPPGDHWAYALGNFNIKAKVANPEDLPPGKDTILPYVWWRVFGRNPRFLREQSLGVNENVLVAPDNTFLHGYFQSEAYFKSIEDRLRQELTFVSPPDPENGRWLDDITSRTSVSIHLRRGDYVSNAKGSSTHAVCDQAYYDRALEQIAERAGSDISVFVFSDDPTWAGQNLKLPFETKVADHNGPDKGHEDMRLIAGCTHNVIANSTFSWWGAWLNANPDKIVVGPKNWFSNSKLDNPDILPSGWIKV